MKDKLFLEYDRLFEKYSRSAFSTILNERGYVFQYDEDETGADLLFVGINPSYTEKHEQNKKYRDSYTRITDRGYFKPFNTINQELLNFQVGYNGIFTHIDLFVFRETNQKEIATIVKADDGIHFLLEQLEIAKQRMIHIRPKVVVVSNSKVREFLGKDRFTDKNGEHLVWMGFSFEFDEAFGTHKVMNVPELKDTHFLFSSMLSGQRALDLGSRERMIWQIKRIFKN